MPPVYLIGLMDMEIPHPDKDFWKDRYISEYTFREKESHDMLDEKCLKGIERILGAAKLSSTKQSEQEL